MIPVAILAGGLATRLRPMTETIPKALIDINGEPFLAHQLRLLKRAGATGVVLCVGYLGEMIREFAGDGAHFGLEVEYSFDGPRLLGTGGAIRRALPRLGEAFFVLYGDSYLPCDYRDVERAFLASGKPGLMTVFRNEGRWDASNIEFTDGRIAHYDKRACTPEMHHIDYGLGAFYAAVFEALAAEEVHDLAAVYQDLLRRNQLAGYEIRERFYEIGSQAGIQELEQYLAAPRRRAVFLDRDGVLNEAIVREGRPYPPAGLEELRIAPGATAALRKLRDAGFLLIVVTNQPDIGRGTQTRQAVDELNAAVKAALPVDEFYVCPHRGAEGCACRKPKPGLLLQAASERNIDLRGSFLIGDRWRDIDAGAAAGCRTVLIDYQYGERGPETAPDYRAGDLSDAAEWILGAEPL
ncbi:MAG TPA: HAD-IIIA family hydrolase [Bryobacteraceae bacterium]|nr:HAD-IIIA family hydrolase [Bryobacteraceae bacterium]